MKNILKQIKEKNIPYVSIQNDNYLDLSQLLTKEIIDNSKKFKTTTKALLKKCKISEDNIFNLKTEETICKFKLFYGGENNLDYLCPLDFITNIEVVGENEVNFECIYTNYALI